MKLLRKFNARLLLLLVFGLVLISGQWWRNQNWIRERRLQLFESEMTDMGVRLSGMMQHFVRRGLMSPGELEMSYAVTTPSLELGLVCDATDRVRFATHIQWMGVAMADTPLEEMIPLANAARASMTPRMVFDDEHTALTGAFPFYEQYHSRDRGVVLLRFNMKAALRQAAHDATMESASQACVLLALCLLLWLVLDVMVTRRVQELADYAQAVGGGGAEHAHDDSGDELSMVTRSFETAVKNLRASELRLVEATEVERRRIGADLHDDVCQRLSAAQLKVGVLGAALRQEDHAQSALADSVADDLAKVTRVARGFAHGLAPMLVERGRLDEALHHLAETLAESFMVRCECSCEMGGKVLDVWVDTHVYRIVQELATNAAKHAQPTLIEITVRASHELLVIRVESDGGELVRRSGAGIGLELVAQRMRALGGQWSIKAREAALGGSVAVCEIPLEPRHYSAGGSAVA